MKEIFFSYAFTRPQENGFGNCVIGCAAPRSIEDIMHIQSVIAKQQGFRTVSIIGWQELGKIIKV